MKPTFGKYERIHLVGVGGAGMSGLAQLLVRQGYQVSGSDRAHSAILERLREQGVRVTVGHRALLVRGADLVVYSAAIPADCEELVEAERRGIDRLGRAEFLGRMTACYATAAVAGTHGKTTTAAMLAAILEAADWSPSVLVGGTVGGEIQGRPGAGDCLVVEADEFDRSFLQLHPASAVVTTVDAEHLDCYDDLDGVLSAFAEFIRLVPAAGPCLLGGDDANLDRVQRAVERNCLTFGRGRANDYRSTVVEQRSWGDRFELFFRGECLGSIDLQVPGLHNVDNATAAGALAHALGVEREPIRTGLSRFTGVDRRFQMKGEAGGIIVVDDYAHHPVEIDAALAAARKVGERVVAVFQPHLYSRTRDFLTGFATALQAADRVILADVYGSREAAIAGVDAGGIAAAMRAAGYEGVEYFSSMEEIIAHLVATCRSGDLVITLGAGDVDRVADGLVAIMRGA